MQWAYSAGFATNWCGFAEQRASQRLENTLDFRPAVNDRHSRNIEAVTN